MKIFFLLFFTIISLISCDNDNDASNNSNGNLLEKVVFYPESDMEMHWLFNSDGLLYKITKADGTLLEEFIYDVNNNVIKDIILYNTTYRTYIIQYNTNNIITKINDINYNYNSSSNNYYYSKDLREFNCSLNADMLVTDFSYIDEVNNISLSFTLEYNNGNMSLFTYALNGKINTSRNFAYNSTINPLLKATLPVLKLKSLTDPSFFKDGISSQSVIQSMYFGNENPLHYNFGMLVYPNNALEQLDIEVYNENIFEKIYTYAKFYYQ